MGGRVAQLNKYFPKLCPPTCGLEINFRRIKTNPRITFYSLAEVESVSGGPGDFNVQVRVNPRYTGTRPRSAPIALQEPRRSRPRFPMISILVWIRGSPYICPT